MKWVALASVLFLGCGSRVIELPPGEEPSHCPTFTFHRVEGLRDSVRVAYTDGEAYFVMTGRPDLGTYRIDTSGTAARTRLAPVSRGEDRRDGWFDGKIHVATSTLPRSRIGTVYTYDSPNSRAPSEESSSSHLVALDGADAVEFGVGNDGRLHQRVPTGWEDLSSSSGEVSRAPLVVLSGTEVYFVVGGGVFLFNGQSVRPISLDEEIIGLTKRPAGGVFAVGLRVYEVMREETTEVGPAFGNESTEEASAGAVVDDALFVANAQQIARMGCPPVLFPENVALSSAMRVVTLRDQILIGGSNGAVRVTIR